MKRRGFLGLITGSAALSAFGQLQQRDHARRRAYSFGRRPRLLAGYDLPRQGYDPSTVVIMVNGTHLHGVTDLQVAWPGYFRGFT